MEDAGFEVESTPIDKLMSNEGLGFCVGGNMEDDDYEG